MNDFQRVSECLQYPMNGELWIAEKFCEINQAKSPYVLVTVNIKNFKYDNMKYGWKAGNEILYRIYGALQSQLAEDEYIAHSYADNYILLLHAEKWDMEVTAANKYIETVIMRFIDAMFEVEDERIYKNIYASFGIYPTNLKPCNYFEALEIVELFRKEDASIKHRTFTVNYYMEEAFQAFVHKYELGKSTANALQNGEYQVYIQPKVDIKTRKIVGGESLLRRFDAQGNQIPLYQFLPILNAEGYIRKIDWFVFETVCKEVGERLEKHQTVVPVSFNISKDFFYDAYMFENYMNTSKKFNIPPEFVEFELMETISLDDTGRMIEVISKFKNAGFRCSLDDFGNGYSSFGVLLNAKLDYVKLDRIFFINPLNEESKKILKSVIDILKSLKFKVVAEGVETKEYVDCLEELGCDIIQGYYFYRPMPLAEFMLLLDEQGQTEKNPKSSGDLDFLN